MLFFLFFLFNEILGAAFDDDKIMGMGIFILTCGH
jgi:hypothetical protein